MQREIRSAEIVKGVNCKYSYIDTFPKDEDPEEEITRSGSETMDTPMHDDYRKAFTDAIPHFILLCGQHKERGDIRDAIRDGMPEGKLSPDSIFYPYQVNKFDIKGSGIKEGIIFTGTRVLPDGGILHLSNPKMNFEEGEYKFMTELINLTERLRDEAAAYADGKQQPPPPSAQEALDFDNLDIGVMEVTAEVVPAEMRKV